MKAVSNGVKLENVKTSIKRHENNIAQTRHLLR